jgi:predicted Zn-dependent protease
MNRALLLPANSLRIVSTVVSFPKMILAAAVLIWCAADSFGHGDVHERINQLTQQISQTPSNATLYFQRADLYRVDQDFTNALADLNRLAQLDPALKRIDFFRGRVLLEAGRPHDAVPALDKYLAGKPDDPDAYTTRARARRKTGDNKGATADYSVAIQTTRVASPDLFIERAEAFRALDKPEDALRSLEDGIRKMGPLVTFELPAIDIEVAMKRYDAALARIDAVTARLQRKETWLARRADILRQAGREEEARKNYREALAAIDRLPPGHRSTRAMVDLQARINSALATNAPAKSK